MAGLCVLVLAKSKQVRQGDMRVYHHEMMAGASSTWLLVLLQWAFCRISFLLLEVFFYLATLREGRQRGLRVRLVHY